MQREREALAAKMREKQAAGECLLGLVQGLWSDMQGIWGASKAKTNSSSCSRRKKVGRGR